MQFSTAFVLVVAAFFYSAEAKPQYGSTYGGKGCKPVYPVMSTTLQPYPGPAPTQAPGPNPGLIGGNGNIGLAIISDDSSLNNKFVSTAHSGAAQSTAVVSNSPDLKFNFVVHEGLLINGSGSMPTLTCTFPSMQGATGQSVAPMIFAPGLDVRTSHVNLESDGFLTIDGEQEWYACPSKDIQLQGMTQIFTSIKPGAPLGVPECKSIKLKMIKHHVV